MEEVQGFTRSHWTPPLGKYYVNIKGRYLRQSILIFFIANMLKTDAQPKLGPN
jgi:hypothetical protein